MDRLEAMSTFLTVVEQGSLSAAARRLKTPLTTVSRNVSELESHLRTTIPMVRFLQGVSIIQLVDEILGRLSAPLSLPETRLVPSQEAVAEHNAIYQRRRDRLVSALRAMGMRVDAPRASLYIWAHVPDGYTSADFATRLRGRVDGTQITSRCRRRYKAGQHRQTQNSHLETPRLRGSHHFAQDSGNTDLASPHGGAGTKRNELTGEGSRWGSWRSFAARPGGRRRREMKRLRNRRKESGRR